MRTHLMLATLALVASASAFAQDAAAEEASEVRSLAVSNYTCRQLLQASGDERDLLLALYHGYQAGKAGSTELDTVKMSFQTDEVIDHCIDKPDDSLMAAFAATSK